MSSEPQHHVSPKTQKYTTSSIAHFTQHFLSNEYVAKMYPLACRGRYVGAVMLLREITQTRGLREEDVRQQAYRVSGGFPPVKASFLASTHQRVRCSALRAVLYEEPSRRHIKQSTPQKHARNQNQTHNKLILNKQTHARVHAKRHGPCRSHACHSKSVRSARPSTTVQLAQPPSHSPRVARGAAIAVPLNAEGATKPDTAPMSTTRRKANSFILEGYGYRYWC